jgi:hypothetical protein
LPWLLKGWWRKEEDGGDAEELDGEDEKDEKDDKEDSEEGEHESGGD